MNKKTMKSGLLVVIALTILLCFASCSSQEKTAKKSVPDKEEASRVSMVASGDIMYHNPILYSAETEDGNYDFICNFEKIKPLISKVDLAIGDFEGCIHPDRPYSGYPMFNAPPQVVEAIKGAGYDVMDLAHNHILDMGLEGAFTTKEAFESVGIDTIGIKDKADSPVLVKKVNGIKIAIIGLCYGYNGMENTISSKDYNAHMEDLDMDKVKKRIEEAEKKADITVIMPQCGNEYFTEPTEEQKEKYRKMVDMGADIIFGGHPHVPEPCEIIEKDGEDKFIIYSMGNLLSNQRIETMSGVLNSQWTERGVIMQVDIEKKDGKTVITGLTPHPTWVQIENGKYQVLLTEEYMPGGKYEGTLNAAETERVQNTYTQVMELMNIDSDLLKPAVK